MAPNSENMWNNMSKDVLNVKKVKPFDYLIPPYTISTPQQKKGPSNMCPWTLSLTYPSSKDMTPS